MMTTITIPMGGKWKVSEVPPDDPKLFFKSQYTWGITYFKYREIYIDEELCKEHKLEVLRHEITHAMIFATQFTHNKKYSEEDVCDLVAKYGKDICDLTNKAYEKIHGGR